MLHDVTIDPINRDQLTKRDRAFLAVSLLIGFVWVWQSVILDVRSVGAAQTAVPDDDVLFLRDNNSVWVRGSISKTKDIAQRYYWSPTNNQEFDFSQTYIITPETPNTVGNYSKGTLVSSVTDDTAPIKTGNASYVMAGHGLVVPQVVSVNHDKTSLDIGSRWTSNGGDYVLMEVAGDNLVFYPVPTLGGVTEWYLSNNVGKLMTHVSGATNQGDIVVGSVSRVQRYPVTKNRVKRVLANGVTEVALKEIGRANFIDFVEEFDLLDPSTINPALGWDGTDEVWMHVKNIYRASAGRTVLHATYEVKRPMYLMLAGMMQVSPLYAKQYDQVFYYIPKTKPIGSFDFSTVQALDGPTGADLYFDSDHITDSTNPPNRQTIFMKRAAEDNYDIAFAFGYSPLLDGSAEARSRNCQQAGDRCWWLAISKKTYPIAVGNVGLIDDKIYETYSYRQWVDQKQYDSGKTAYWHEVDGHKMLYVDYYAPKQRDLMALPSSYQGRVVKVVESSGITINDSLIGQDGLDLSVTEGAQSGYLVAELLDALPAPIAPRVQANRGDTLNIYIDESEPSNNLYAISCGDGQYLSYERKACVPLTDSADVWRTRADWGGDQGALFEGTQPSTSYTFKLRYRDNGGGHSSLSEETSVITGPALTVIKDSFSGAATTSDFTPWTLRTSGNNLDDGTGRTHFELTGSALVFRLVGGKDFHSLYRRFSDAKQYTVLDRATVDFDFSPISTQDKSEVRFSLVNSKGFSVSSAIGFSLQNVSNRWTVVMRLTGKPGTAYKESVVSKTVILSENIQTGGTYHAELSINSGEVSVNIRNSQQQSIGSVSMPITDAAIYNSFDAFSINDYNTGKNIVNGEVRNDITLIEGWIDNLLVTAEDL